MSAITLTAVQTLRAEHRQRLNGPTMLRLWHAVRNEWLRRCDRASAMVVSGRTRAGDDRSPVSRSG